MNSINIISARVSPTSSPAPSRSNSLSHIDFATASNKEGHAPTDTSALADREAVKPEPSDYPFDDGDSMNYFGNSDENTPLLEKGNLKEVNVRSFSWHVVPARMANTIIISMRWVLSTIAAPGVYLIACFYDAQGNFAPLRQLNNLYGNYGGDVRKLAADYHENITIDEKAASPRRASHSRGKPSQQPPSSGSSSSSGMSSESETDLGIRSKGRRRSSSSVNRHTRSKSLQPDDETGPARRSIRIKLHNDENLRRHKKSQSTSSKSSRGSSLATTDLSAQLKSPTSPVGALTKYPKTPAPPRPLIPRRQPSYVPYEPVDPKHMKTLILDLDETLIHSMSKGGRMGSGHMVEVRLNTTYVASGGSQALGPQHPILYYVHKRPHCDEFLRKVRLSAWLMECQRCLSNYVHSRSASGSTWSSSRRPSRSTLTPSSTGWNRKGNSSRRATIGSTARSGTVPSLKISAR